MGARARFEAYMDHLACGLGHTDRHAGLEGYCTGLMLPPSRKSVEPMAARSVGVARQYCGVLGKQDNCQVAVSVSLATEQASVPVAYRLYLPKEWAQDPERRRKAHVPAEVDFAPRLPCSSWRRCWPTGPRGTACSLMRATAWIARFVSA